MNDRDRERLAEEIARSRVRVADLERERDVELMRITELEAEIAALDAIAAAPPSGTTHPGMSRTAQMRKPSR